MASIDADRFAQVAANTAARSRSRSVSRLGDHAIHIQSASSHRTKKKRRYRRSPGSASASSSSSGSSGSDSHSAGRKRHKRFPPFLDRKEPSVERPVAAAVAAAAEASVDVGFDPLLDDVLLGNEAKHQSDAKAGEIPSQQVRYVPLLDDEYLHDKEDEARALEANGTLGMCPFCEYQSESSNENPTDPTDPVAAIIMLGTDYGQYDTTVYARGIQTEYNNNMRNNMPDVAKTKKKPYWSLVKIVEHFLQHRPTPAIRQAYRNKVNESMATILARSGVHQKDETGRSTLNLANARFLNILLAKT